jgi:hypothetical protein
MTAPDILSVNFTLSEAAKRAIADLRDRYNRQFAPKVADVLSIGWGHIDGGDPLTSGGLVLGFYTKEERSKVAHGIQTVSGVEFVYFTTDEFHPLFESKILDHSEERGFFLRAP